VRPLPIILAFGLFITVSSAHGQSEDVRDRELKIIEPRKAEQLDPAFEMIMEKLDSDLRYILSSPVRITPKGTALAGLTVLGTLFLLDEDEDYLNEVVASEGEKSDKIYNRLRVLGRHVPEFTAGFYLLGYFLDDPGLKSRSLGSIEAVAITALVTAGSGYIIGRKGPDASPSSDDYEPFSKYHSMPDVNTSLVFSMASVFAYDRPLHQALIFYGIAAGTAMSRVYFEESWPSDVFLGSVLGTVIGRTVAARSRGEREPTFSVLPMLEHNAKPVIGLKVEFKL
jgi:hypothetical protein